MKKFAGYLAVAVIAGALGLFMGGASAPTSAQEKQQPTKSIEEFCKASEEYQKGDLVKRCELLAQWEKDKKIDYNQSYWMKYREALAHFRAKGIAGDATAICKWCGEQAKDYKNPINKHAYSVLSELTEHYGMTMLYKDETYTKADTKGKLNRIRELWEARMIGQSMTYELVDDLVARFMAPAGGDINKQIDLFAELVKDNAVVWDTTAPVHRMLMRRAIYEKPELDTVEKKLKWLTDISDSKNGKLSWMMVGTMRLKIVIDVIDGDAEWQKMAPADRVKKIDEWVKGGQLTSSDKSYLVAMYAEVDRK